MSGNENIEKVFGVRGDNSKHSDAEGIFEGEQYNISGSFVIPITKDLGGSLMLR